MMHIGGNHDKILLDMCTLFTDNLERLNPITVVGMSVCESCVFCPFHFSSDLISQLYSPSVHDDDEG